MKNTFMEIIFCCLLLNFNAFSQSEDDGIVEEKETVTTQSSEETIGKQEEAASTDMVQSAKEESVLVEENQSTEDENKTVEQTDKHTQGSATDITQLREEARLLQLQAENLVKKAEKFGDDTEEADDAIEDLEELVDELEEEAEELLEQAGKLQMCIKIEDEARAAVQISDTSIVVGDSGDTSSATGDQEHKVLMLKMRNSADQLLMKAKEISVQVREMKETSGEKDDLSDRFEDKADELEEKAEELEETADSLEEQQNVLPLAHRYPFRLGHQLRISAVPPYDDKNAHILLFSGLHFSYYFRNFIGIGLEEMTLRFNETIYGTRVAICASPIVSYSFFPLKKLELGIGAGVAIQGQVGADRSYDLSAAPFIKLFNETWVVKRFSLGPVLKFNYCANGEFFTRVLPSEKAKVLPKKAWWMDFGLTYTFHI